VGRKSREKRERREREKAQRQRIAERAPRQNYPQHVHVLSAGTTATERLLARLAHRTFLTFWSYPNVYRNQGAEGKEVCDLLVVFGNNLIVFSDKECAFPPGEIKLAWYR
jgi:hypothetical protein